jgi:hypothetical protein
MERRTFGRRTGVLRAAAVVLGIAAAGCGQPAQTTAPPPSTTSAAPTSAAPASASPTSAAPVNSPSQELRNLAEEACLATEYTNCVDGLLEIAQTAPGSLVAICDYGNQTGDIVVIEAEGDAQAECSADGSISPSRVVGVLQLP